MRAFIISPSEMEFIADDCTLQKAKPIECNSNRCAQILLLTTIATVKSS